VIAEREETQTLEVSDGDIEARQVENNNEGAEGNVNADTSAAFEAIA